MLRVAIYFIFAFCLSCANAQCNFESAASNGALVSAESKNGFATMLVANDLPQIFIRCEGGPAAITVSKPVRVEDSGPILKGPAKSYIIYKDKTYTDKQQVIISGGSETHIIQIKMSLGNDGDILPASKDYAYQVVLSATNLTSQETSTHTFSTELNNTRSVVESGLSNEQE